MSAIPASIFDVGQKDQNSSRNMVHAKIISPHFVQRIFSTEQMQEMSSASIHTFYPFELQKLELQNGQTTVEERGSLRWNKLESRYCWLQRSFYNILQQNYFCLLRHSLVFPWQPKLGGRQRNAVGCIEIKKVLDNLQRRTKQMLESQDELLICSVTDVRKLRCILEQSCAKSWRRLDYRD